MSLFFSMETMGRADKVILPLMRLIDKSLKDIDIKNYTKDIDSIGIIINCFNKKSLDEGFGKPRKYISYKQRFADIRLNISYEELMSADKERQYEMVKQNIYDSIMVVDEKLNKKKGCSFDGERMIADIEAKLKDLKI